MDSPWLQKPSWLDPERSAEMGRLRFELRTSRLKAGCSTAELATRPSAGAIVPEQDVP